MDKYALLPELAWNWTSSDAPRRNEEGALLAMLTAIAETGSVAQGARACGYSYRHGWGLVRTWEERLRQPLVDMARGRGSTLAPLGLRLVRLDAQLKSRFAAQLAAAAAEVRRELAPFMAAGAPRLSLHASPDPALARLPEALRAQGIELELHVLGSSEALASFAAGGCDLAGFRCPQGRPGEAVWRAYRASLDPSKHVLIRFARRAQGLMFPAGKRQRLRKLRDLTRPGVRFVNRQAGSGARLMLDLLLAESEIRSQDIAGYDIEEYTDAAVAATIASGAADAGLGAEAAARRFGLDFMPLVREDYYLAARRDALSQPAFQILLKVLTDAVWRSALAAEPGYDARGCGRVTECEAAWQAAKATPARPRR